MKKHTVIYKKDTNVTFLPLRLANTLFFNLGPLCQSGLGSKEKQGGWSQWGKGCIIIFLPRRLSDFFLGPSSWTMALRSGWKAAYQVYEISPLWRLMPSHKEKFGRRYRTKTRYPRMKAFEILEELPWRTLPSWVAQAWCKSFVWKHESFRFHVRGSHVVYILFGPSWWLWASELCETSTDTSCSSEF